MEHVIVVLVHGGVADTIQSTVPDGITVDIVDIDNLEETTAEDFRADSLTQAGKDYLKHDWPELAARLGIE